MSHPTLITGARIFDGALWHDDMALAIEDGHVIGILSASEFPADAVMVETGGGLLVPGFIDLQVNGGGGVMLNDQPSLEGITRICAAHAQFGTTALLPTLITDTRPITQAAIAAGKQAKAANIPGFLGLHLEGPHLSVSRKGAHDPALIRPMDAVDLAAMLDCRGILDVLMVTIAPENTSPQQAAALAAAGFIVSLGHTDASYETAAAYAGAGVRTVTHLFNAMSPLGHREAGLVGAALGIGGLSAGLIADGFHVDPVSMGIALRAKQGPGRIFLVTDAMSTIGTDLPGFTLNGRQILRHEGRLTLADGTLAGADIDMLSSVRFVHEKLGLPLADAIRMATVYPAEAVGLCERKGALGPGLDADFVLLSDDLQMKSTWISGRCVFQSASTG